MNSDSMIFVDTLDNLINVVQFMVDYHINKKYEELRHIIIGYDPIHKQWISKYGQVLEKKLIHNEARNKDINKVKVNSIYTSSINSSNIDPENFDRSMMLYDDQYNNVRFHMDEFVKRILYVLFTLSDRIIDYRYVIDLIISDWNLKNMTNNMVIKMEEPDICGELYFHQIEVRKDAWKEFKKITKQKGLTIRDGFKQAIILFLEDRIPLINNLEQHTDLNKLNTEVVL